MPKMSPPHPLACQNSPVSPRRLNGHEGQRTLRSGIAQRSPSEELMGVPVCSFPVGARYRSRYMAESPLRP